MKESLAKSPSREERKGMQDINPSSSRSLRLCGFARNSPLPERIGTVAFGLAANTLLNWFFDIVVYGYAIWALGAVYGGGLMTLCSAVYCIAAIRFYDWSGRDWLGIETLKGLREYEETSSPLPSLPSSRLVTPGAEAPASDGQMQSGSFADEHSQAGAWERGVHFIRRIIAWALRRGGVPLFLLLSIQYDPFVTVVFMRRGAHEYRGMSARDWGVFWSSVVVSNGYWILVLWLGMGVLEWAWKMIG